jgi:hypothetical protein
MRRAYQVGALVWAAVGLIIALSSQSQVNADVRPLIGTLSVALPLTAVLAAAALDRERDRVAGIFLLVSAATPTYFAWPVNLPALIVGGILLIRGRVSLRRVPGPSGSESSGPAT